MSNLIPYFVLAVVALGFFAVCYAVFSGGDGESKAKEKSYKNISNKNNLKLAVENIKPNHQHTLQAIWAQS